MDIHVPAETYPCPHCDRSFASKTGLGVHKNKRHPIEYNRDLHVPNAKARWTTEETALLAQEEARALKERVRFINPHLAKVFKHRTLDAIKSHRRGTAYQELVKQAMTKLSNLDSTTLQDQHDITHERSELHNDMTEPGLHTFQINIIEHMSDLLKRARPSTNWGLTFLIGHINNIIKGNNNSIPDDYFDEYVFTGARSSRGPRRHTPRTKRTKTHSTYKQLQFLFKKNRSKCAQQVLNPSVAQPGSVNVEGLKDFWTAVFTTVTPQPVPELVEPTNALYDVLRPITIDEIKQAKLKAGSAPGPDGMTVKQLNTIPSWALAVMFNSFLLKRDLPKRLKLSRTRLIPKKDIITGPGDFRPITLTPVMLRLFHRVLAKRLMTNVTINDMQRGFIPSDGCYENTALLYELMRKAREKHQTLHVAFLDVKKAFDSVSMAAIARALVAKGLPREFSEYVLNSYKESETILQYEETSHKIRPNRGVKQGDPLSPIIFNLVIDQVLDALPDDVGFPLRINDQVHCVKAMAFADDLILVTRTAIGMQTMLDQVSSSMKDMGLELNPSKCNSLSLIGLGKAKKTKVLSESSFKLYGDYIPALNVEQSTRYLGVTFNSRGRPSAHITFNDLIKKLKSSPLKPQQKIYILRQHIIPKLLHPVVLSDISLGKLKTLDLELRRAVRQILHLPKDLPNSFVHLGSRDGGLDVPSMALMVPILQSERLKRLACHPLPVFRSLAHSSHAKKVHTLVKRVYRGEEPKQVTMTKILKRNLEGMTDGFLLREANLVPELHNWVVDATRYLKGREYVNFVKIRYNAMPCLSRTTRGTQQDRKCRTGVCHKSETLNHIQQICPKTHGMRIVRHDAILTYITDILKKKGHKVLREPTIDTESGKYVPDLIIEMPERTMIMDVHVTGQTAQSLDRTAKMKIARYSDSAVLVKKLEERYRNELSFHGLTMTYSGIMSRSMAKALRGLKVNTGELRKIVNICLSKTYAAWVVFMKGTSIPR